MNVTLRNISSKWLRQKHVKSQNVHTAVDKIMKQKSPTQAYSTKLLCQCLIYKSFFLSRRLIVEAIKHCTYFSVSYTYSHTNNQTNSTVCNLQLISWAMCTKTCFLPSLTLISCRFGRRQRLKKTRPTLHSSIASSKRNTVQSHQICIAELCLWTKTRYHPVV